MKLLLTFIFLFHIYFGTAQQIIQPFLQNLSSNKATIVWEANACDSGVLEWGESLSFSHSILASSIQSSTNTCIYSATIENLISNTLYNYKAINGSYSSKILSFVTPSISLAEKSIRLIAISDMQKDNSHPDVFQNIIDNGIISHIENNFNGSLSHDLQMVLIPGDLVDNGNNHEEWVHDFFDAGKNLFSYVPIYPVLGNHENNSTYFFDYFDLPKNGSSGFKEHWWFMDQSNIRIIGMDSNWDYQIPTQLEWLDSVLNSTVNDTVIDFVFAQLHHPHHSELWPVGNTDFTGLVINKLEDFTNLSGKPSVHLFGHTHGYSRGQSKDHRHLMVNVASAGGNIDYWEEYFQQDFEEYSISQDEYGFVLVEVKAGSNPYFVLKRFSLGDQYQSKNNTLEDSICIKFNPINPLTPIAQNPVNKNIVSPDGFLLQGSPFYDSDDDGHGATQWQISIDSTSFSSPIIDHWIQYQNIYKEVDLLKGNNLTEHQINTLLPNKKYYWRFRYRDKGLNWSDWSAIETFNTDSAYSNWNLYPNPAQDNATLHLPYSVANRFDVKIFNQKGEMVRDYNGVYPPVLTIEKRVLKKGNYLISVFNESGLVKTLKLNFL
jgi:hypothetical protein